MIELKNRPSPDIIVIGGGIQGAYAANYFLDLGMIPLLIDGNPDPRWLYDPWGTGTTKAGGDARHGTRREMSCWASPARLGFLELLISQGGMRAIPLGQDNSAQKEAIEVFNSIARSEVTYKYICQVATTMNDLGLRRWWQWIRQEPRLFEGITQHPVVAFCKGADFFQQEVAAEKEARSPIEVLDDVAVTQRYPSLIQAVRSGQITGGIVQHDSFAVNAISLLGRLLDRIENKGGAVMHDTKVVEIAREKGVVSGVRIQDGSLLQARDITAFPGRDGGVLSAGTPLADKLMGVAGVWHAIPRITEIPIPFKILLNEQPTFVNVTHNGDRSWISGGFGWLGQQEAKRDNPELIALENILKDFMKGFLPDKYHPYINKPLDSRLCVRPSSRSNLTRHHYEPTTTGGFYALAEGDSGGGLVRAPVGIETIAQQLRGIDQTIVGAPFMSSL